MKIANIACYGNVPVFNSFQATTKIQLPRMSRLLGNHPLSVLKIRVMLWLWTFICTAKLMQALRPNRILVLFTALRN